MTDKNIEIWKMKKLISKLQSVRGNGTSMISIIIKPGDQIFRINKMLTDEAGTASNIKSRVNRLSVLSAITSAQQRLKLRNKIPTNGLVVYCGTIMMDDGKEKKFSIDFEPFRPVNTSLYMCDNKFHTEALASLLEDDMKFGFIIMDGNGVLFANLSGNTKVTLAKFSVDLPKKHSRGGQSALRFARLRVEKRNNYVRKVAETACQLFITNDKVNVEGIILAGSADFKTDLHGSNLFDMRLLAKVIKKVDISYGGNQGLHQAILLSMDCISNLKFVQEQKLISKFFEEINQNTGRSCYGIDDIVNGLKMGVIETIIAWENLPLIRYSLINNESGETCEKILRPEQSKIASNFIDKASKVKLEIVDEQLYLDYLAEKYNEYGAGLETVSDKSPEGSQFVKGFGGIGGLLRYKVDFVEIAELDYDSQDDFYMDAYDI